MRVWSQIISQVFNEITLVMCSSQGLVGKLQLALRPRVHNSRLSHMCLVADRARKPNPLVRQRKSTESPVIGTRELYVVTRELSPALKKRPQNPWLSLW